MAPVRPRVPRGAPGPWARDSCPWLMLMDPSRGGVRGTFSTSGETEVGVRGRGEKRRRKGE